jgi:signal transduction histidine kinase
MFDLDGWTVQDTGSGISPEIFPRLFSKFSSKSFSGTGLGLYIAKNIVEAHGGKIWVQNNNGQGKCGAAFSFSLPLD